MCGSPISEKRAARTRARGHGRRVVTSITIINYHQLSPINACSLLIFRTKKSKEQRGQRSRARITVQMCGSPISAPPHPAHPQLDDPTAVNHNHKSQSTIPNQARSLLRFRRKKSKEQRGQRSRARITVQMCGSPIFEKRAARTRARGHGRRVVT